MPAPKRTTDADVIAAGRRLIAERGLDGLTMQAVASAVGVRAPSLYKRVRGRDELIRLVVESTLGELEERLTRVVSRAHSDPRAVVEALVVELRTFAHGDPSGFALAFGGAPAEARPSIEVLARSAAPLTTATTQLVGPEHALAAARTVTAWAVGFVTMELTGAFQLGGDVDSAFAWGLSRLIEAVADPGQRTASS